MLTSNILGIWSAFQEHRTPCSVGSLETLKGKNSALGLLTTCSEVWPIVIVFGFYLMLLPKWLIQGQTVLSYKQSFSSRVVLDIGVIYMNPHSH